MRVLLTDREALDVQPCALCGAPVVWAERSTGKSLPIDLERRVGGTLVLFAETLNGVKLGPYQVRLAGPEARAELGGLLWSVHPTVCKVATKAATTERAVR